MSGWIKLYRDILNSESWLKEPFTRGQAWIDLLMLTNFRPGHIRVAGERVDIDRGQCGWSTVRLAERWRWSRGKVIRYLNELEEVEQQIVQQTDASKNRRCKLITIVNYDTYQSGNGTTDNTPNDTTDSTTDDTTDGTTDGTGYKKEKKVKKEKKNKELIMENPKIKFSEFVELTQEEYDKLVIDFGEDFTKECIKQLDNYIPNMTRKPYKDHNRAIRSWVIKRVKEDGSVLNTTKTLGRKDRQGLGILEDIRQEEAEKKRTEATSGQAAICD